MAGKNNQQGVDSGTMEAIDGWNFVGKCGGDYLGKLFETYSCRVTGFKVQQLEKGTKVTAKIVFEGEPSWENMNYWTWMIGSAIFPGFGKVMVTTGSTPEGRAGYASFVYWNTVEYRESKRTSVTF